MDKPNTEIGTEKLLQIIGMKEVELQFLREHLAQIEAEKNAKPLDKTEA